MAIDINILARQINPEQTVLVLGAGASIPSGAPTGNDLRDQLGREFGVSSDLPPLGPSFITRVCGFEIGSRVGRSGQARRARSPQIAQASGALRAVSGSRARNAV